MKAAPLAVAAAILGPSQNGMADRMVAFQKERVAMNPSTFVLRAIHPEDGQPRYFAISADRTSKGAIIEWTPFWSVDPAMALPFEDRRDAACAQAHYGACCTDDEHALWNNAVIVKRTSRLKEKP